MQMRINSRMHSSMEEDLIDREENAVAGTWRFQGGRGLSSNEPLRSQLILLVLLQYECTLFALIPVLFATSNRRLLFSGPKKGEGNTEMDYVILVESPSISEDFPPKFPFPGGGAPLL